MFFSWLHCAAVEQNKMLTVIYGLLFSLLLIRHYFSHYVPWEKYIRTQAMLDMIPIHQTDHVYIIIYVTTTIIYVIIYILKINPYTYIYIIHTYISYITYVTSPRPHTQTSLHLFMQPCEGEVVCSIKFPVVLNYV